MVIEAEILNNKAESGSGGGIDFVCPEDDFGENDCTLEIDNSKVEYNMAREGGGIKYHDIIPIIKSSTFENNEATLYGNQKASFPTKLVQFIPHTQAFPDEDFPELERDYIYFSTFFDTKTELTQNEILSDPEAKLVAEQPI